MQKKSYVLITIFLSLNLIGYAQNESPAKLRRLVKAGDCVAMYKLAQLYESGTKVKQSDDEAFKYYEKSAELDYLPAMEWMINHYEMRILQNERMYFLWVEKIANAGNPQYEYLLSKMYCSGRGVDIDHKLCVYYCKMAALHGLYQARFDLARMYLYGENGEKSIKNAIVWLDSLASEGCVSSQLILADMYYTGFEVVGNVDISRKYYTMAAEAGNPVAQACLIHSLSGKYHGLAMPDEYKYWKEKFISNPVVIKASEDNEFIKEEPLTYYTLAAYDSLQNISMLALVYELTENINAFTNIDTLINSINLKASFGNPYAQAAASWHCVMAQGTNCSSLSQSYEYAKKGSAAGIAISHYLIALMNHNGIYFKANNYDAVRYYEKAMYSIPEIKEELLILYAKQDQWYNFARIYRKEGVVKTALQDYQMGIYCLHTGNSAEQNETALKYIQLAADKGLYEAKLFLGVEYFDCNRVERNCDLSYDILFELANNGCFVSKYYLAMMMFEGCGTVVDTINAIPLLRESADKGFSLAQYEYANLIYNGKVEGVKKSQSVEYYTKSAEQGHKGSMYKLGYIYYEGKFGKKDNELAYSFFSGINDATGEAEYMCAKMICEKKYKSDVYGIESELCYRALSYNYPPADDLWVKYKLEKIFQSKNHFYRPN